VVFTVRPSPGSELTISLAGRHGKPLLVLNPWAPDAATKLERFLKGYQPRTLNVAGHRESKAPGIYMQVYRVLSHVFSGLVLAAQSDS